MVKEFFCVRGELKSQDVQTEFVVGGGYAHPQKGQLLPPGYMESRLCGKNRILFCAGVWQAGESLLGLQLLI